MHLDDLNLLIRFLSSFEDNQENSSKVQETKGLEMAKRFLTSPYFEKRIRGL